MQRRVGNFYFLFAGLMISLVSAPVSALLVGEMSSIAQQTLFSITLLLGLWTLAPERRWFLLGLLLASLQILLSLAALVLGAEPLIFPILICSLVFCVVSAGFAGYHVFAAEGVDEHRLVGALCVYLLLGVIWTLLYSIVELSVDGAFSGLQEWHGGERLRELGYFSFVTLTTLGFGDVLPEVPVAKTLAYLEAVAGQFYLTVLVAELVGTHVALRHSRRERRATDGPAPTVD